MIFEPTNCRLFCLDFTGASVSMDVDTLNPIQMALQADGGRIKLIRAFIGALKKEFFWINYFTLDGRIRLSFELNKSEYLYYVDFFGNTEVTYEGPITFILENNKLILP